MFPGGDGPACQTGLGLTDVAAGHEGLLPRPGQDHHPYSGVVAGSKESLFELLHGDCGQDVEGLGPVDGDRGHAIGGRDE